MITFMNRRHWAFRSAIATVVLGAVGVSIAVAEDIWINRPFVDVRAGKGSLYPILGRANQGDKLTVKAHEDNWLHVQFNGQDGYILANAVSTSEVHGEMFTDLKGSDSSGATAASAGKGFTPSDFAAAKGYSEEPLMNLESAVKLVVTPQGLDKFMVLGKIGDAKPARQH